MCEVVMDDFVLIKVLLSIKFKMDNFIYLEMGENIGLLRIILFVFSIELCFMWLYSIYCGSGKGFIFEDNIMCYICLNGGDCLFFFVVWFNFWGYFIGDKVYFKLCLEGYCCLIVS